MQTQTVILLQVEYWTNGKLLIWPSGNGVYHINKVKLHPAQLVLGLLNVGGCTIPVFLEATQPGHPSVDRCSEYWRWFWPPPVKKRQVLRSGGLCYKTAGILAYTSLTGSNLRQFKSRRE